MVGRMVGCFEGLVGGWWFGIGLVGGFEWLEAWWDVLNFEGLVGGFVWLVGWSSESPSSEPY